MKADLHLHTEASFDSHISFEERLESARNKSFDTIALTDHNAIHPRLTMREEKFRDTNVITGIEIFSFGDFGELHILGFFVDPDTLRDRVRGEHRTGYRHAIRHVHDAGGVAVLAHPRRYSTDLVSVVEALSGMGLDGLELEYPYEKLGIDPRKQELQELGEKHNLVFSGGSDCHGGRRKAIGEVSVDQETVDSLRERSTRYR